MVVYGLLAIMVGSIMAFLVIIILIYVAGYKKVPPDSVMILYGKGASENKDGMTIISAGGRFILPIVQSYEILKLHIQKIKMIVVDIPVKSSQGDILMSLRITALIRVSENVNIMKNAVKRILRKTEAEVEELVRDILNAHIMKVCHGIQIEWLDGHKEETAAKIISSASTELAEIGIETSSLHITEVLDQ